MFLHTILNQIYSRSLIIIFNQISIFFIISLIAVRFDLETFGHFGQAMILIQIGWIVSNFGLINYSIESKLKLKRSKLLSKFVWLAILQILLLSVTYVLFLFCLIQLNILNLPEKFYLFTIPSIIFGSFHCMWFFQSMNEPNTLVKVTFYSRLIFLLATYFFIFNDNHLHFFIIQAATLLIVALYSLRVIFYKYNLNFSLPPMINVFNTTKYQLPFFINLITNTHINILWSFVASLSLSPAMMSIYYIGDQVFRSCGAFSSIFSQVFRSNTLGQKNKKLINYFKKIIWFYVAIFGLIAIAALLYFYYYLPTNYIDGLNITLLMIIAALLSAINKLLNYPILGKKFGYLYVNKLTTNFLILNIIVILIWYFVFKMIILVPILLIINLLLQILFFSYKYICMPAKNIT